MNAEATRMQDLASEFSKNFPGVTPPDPHSGRGRPSPAPTPSPASGRARGTSAPVLGPKSWFPQLFSCGCAPGATSVPILVVLGLSVLELGPMYATDRRQTRIIV